MHYKKETMYLNKVAGYLTSLGYDVEEPSTKHRDFLDVWGKIGNRKCFEEIYVHIYECNEGINGVWSCFDREPVEVFLNCFGDLVGAEQLVCILGDLKPIHKLV